MKKERLLEALSDIDGDLVAEAARPARGRVLPFVRRAGAAAAAFLVVVGAGLLLRNGFSMKNAAPEADNAVDLDFSCSAGVGQIEEEKDCVKVEGYLPTDDAVTVPDIAPADPVTQLTFYLYRDSQWVKETVAFSDGVPAPRELVSEYLSRAGAAVTCVDVKMTETEGQETVLGGVVTYIPPHRTATVILSDAPEGGMAAFDGLLRGLILSIHPGVGADLYKLETDEGIPMYFGLSQPLGGYDPDTLWPEGVRE